MNNKVHIALITDNNYVFPTKIMLRSLLVNKRPESVYHIHIIGVDINEASQPLLLSQATGDMVIDLLLTHNDYAAIGLKHSHVSKAALFKFMLPHIFPELDKILYLDTDMIVRDDLTDLYNTDLQHYLMAAVKDCGNVFSEHTSLIHTRDYFNSGLMLFNLDLCRQENTSEKLFEAKQQDTIQRFMDQDAFNTVFDQKTLFLPMKYNCMAYNLARYTDEDLAGYYGLSKEQFVYDRLNPVILHLTNKVKPWTDALKPGADEFWKYTEKMDVIRYVTLRLNRLQPKAGLEGDTVYYALFGIPLFKKRQSRSKIRYYFWGIEIFKKKIFSPRKTKYYVLGLVVWKIKKIQNKKTHYLLSFLPVLSTTTY